MNKAIARRIGFGLAMFAGILGVASSYAAVCPTRTIPDLNNQALTDSGRLDPRILIVFVNAGINPGFSDAVEDVLRCISYDRLQPVIENIGISFDQEGKKEPELRQEIVRGIRAQQKDPCDYDRILAVNLALFGPAGGFGTLDHQMSFLGTLRPNKVAADARIGVHEIGHSIDWKHTGMWIPDDPAAGPLSTGEEDMRRNFGDWYDIMRSPGGGFHHPNPWYKQRAGWLEDEEVLDINGAVELPMEVRLRDLDATPSADLPSAIRIRIDEGHDYWVTWRRYWGRRSAPAACNASMGTPLLGPVVNLGHRSNIGRSTLIDLDPSLHPMRGPDPSDAELVPGASFVDVERGIEIVYRNEDSQGNALVEVHQVPGRIVEDPVVIGLANIPPLGDWLSSPGVSSTHVAGYPAWEWEILAHDPAVGTENGAGIAKVEAWIGGAGLHSKVSGTLEESPTVPEQGPASELFPTPGAVSMVNPGLLSPGDGFDDVEFVGSGPYRWTPTSPDQLPFGKLWLIIRATSIRGHQSVAMFPHLLIPDSLQPGYVESGGGD